MKKTVVITGGTSGIGKACAQVYAKNNYNVVFTGRDKERIIEMQVLLENLGANCLGIKANVEDFVAAEGVVKTTISEFGSIDVLICNAGVSMKALFEEIDLKVVHRVMDVNYYGTVYYVKAALPYLFKSKGSVVGISSINGKKGTLGRSAYCASKFAIEGFLESLRLEVNRKGVHVMSVCPGYTQSNIRNSALTADGRVHNATHKDESKLMSAEKVAVLIFKNQQKRKRSVVLTLLGRALIFLNKRFPKLIDWIVFRVMTEEDPSLLHE